MIDPDEARRLLAEIDGRSDEFEEQMRAFKQWVLANAETLLDELEQVSAEVERLTQERDELRAFYDKAAKVSCPCGCGLTDPVLQDLDYGQRRHVGEIRGVVAAEVRRQRLATALVHELVDQASLKGLKKIEAQPRWQRRSWGQWSQRTASPRWDRARHASRTR